MPTIETQHLLPSALPQYIRNDCNYPYRVPEAAIASLCSLDEPTVVELRPSPVSFRAPLLVWLPDTLPEQLALLASAEPEVENHTSADLLSSRTYLVWRAPNAQIEVQLDTWDLARYMAGIDSELAIVFVGPGHAVAVRLRYGPREAEAFVAALQAAASGSGPNWRPRRIYSDEEMQRAEGEVAPVDSSILVPRVATLTLRN